MQINGFLDTDLKYMGEICREIGSYYVMLIPQPSKAIPMNFKNFIAASFTLEGYLSSFEYLTLMDISRNIPDFKDLKIIKGVPIFDIYTASSTNIISIFCRNDVFFIQIQSSIPTHVCYCGNLSFYFLNNELVAFEVINCIVN